VLKLIENGINLVISLFYKSWKYLKRSYSQEGEDTVLDSLLNGKEKGFYVDVGAHHPFRFSNTYLFYKKGWKGINVDATPGSMDLFKKYRSKDINIESAVLNSTNTSNYYVFREPAINGFSEKLTKWRLKNTNYKLKKTIKIKPVKLFSILDKYVPKGKLIDFMNIDVEGFELDVLLSNNWDKYSPIYILVELLRVKPEELANDKIYKFLNTKKYQLVAFTGRTAFFKKNIRK
jgi:FkbM family methyltransferase